MKNASKKVLKGIRILLDVAWYTNMGLIVIALGMLTWKFCTSDTAEFSALVKYPLNPAKIPLPSISSNAEHVTIQADQALIKFNIKNTIGYMALAYFLLIAFEVLIMTIIYHLRLFFKSIKQNKPFNYPNVRSLKITAVCFASLTVLHALQGISTSIILNASVKGYDKMHMVWSDSLTNIILGCVIWVVADVFKYGFELKKEIEEFV